MKKKMTLHNISTRNKFSSGFKSLSILLFVLLVSGKSWGQTTVTIGGGASITCPAIPTATWTTPPTGVSFSNWSRGGGVTCGTSSSALSGSGFNTASASASYSANKYYSFTITADATHSFTLNSFVWNTAVSSGTANFTVQYSNNGGALTTFGTAAQTSTSSNTFSGSVSIYGFGFGLLHSSLVISLRTTQAPVSLWTSESSVSCKAHVVVGLSITVHTSVGINVCCHVCCPEKW